MQHASPGTTTTRCWRLCPHRLWANSDTTGEEGFTLIELVMVLIIMPLIVGAASVVMITSLKTTSDTNGTTARLAESHDAQITSTYFGRDVQNSTRLTTSGASLLCGNAGTQLLGLVTNGGQSAVSYASTTIGGSAVLVRYYCASGPASIATNVATMAHTLQSTSSAALAPLVCNAAYSSSCQTDASKAEVASLAVAIVEIDVTEKTGFSFSLKASPRQQIGSTLGLVAASPPLLLLGSGGATCGPGNEGLTVNGSLAVNSSQAGSITIGNKKLSAQQVYSQPIDDGGKPVSPANRYVQQNAPPGTPPYATGPALVDPYGALPPPSPSAPNTYVYATPLTTGNDTPTTLKSGIYILEDGIDASLTSDPGGVFFYVTGGSVNLGGNANLDLEAMTSGPYAGLLLYQVPADKAGLTLSGTPSINSLDGVIDASAAAVTLKGNATISSLGLVADSVSCNGTTSGSFGPQATTTTVSSSGNPSLSGQPVTFTASVAGTAGPVSGNVTFSITANGGSSVGCTNGGDTQKLDVFGQATCATPPLTHAGSPYSVTANYPGVLGYEGSSGSLKPAQSVRVVTSTSVAVSPSNPVSGQAVTLTATVAGTGPPSGVVSFTIKDGNNKAYNCAGGSNAIALSGGSAACTISSGQLLSTNSPFTMSATYPGDADNAPSTWGPTNLVVTPGQVHLSALTGTGSTPKGGNWQATVTAMVTDASGNTVSGVVVTGTWAPAGPAPSGCTTMANGQCSFTAPGIPAASGETWTIAGLAVPGYTYDPTKNSQSSEAINHA